MYLLGFLGCWCLGTRRARLRHVNWPVERVGDLLSYVLLGVVLGGRIGYTFFYNLPGFLDHLTVLFLIWEGGMSFHGGLIGVLVAIGVFARRRRLAYFEVGDFAAVLAPFGLFTGRIGNFINGELWGAPTNMPWGMVFPRTGPGSRWIVLRGSWTTLLRNERGLRPFLAVPTSVSMCRSLETS